MMTPETEVLIHHGVLGMKWGVCKDGGAKWRDREDTKLAKRTMKQTQKDARKVKRAQRKYDDTLDKYGPLTAGSPVGVFTTTNTAAMKTQSRVEAEKVAGHIEEGRRIAANQLMG